MPHLYAELYPDTLASLIEADAPAIVPWGALEWHGDHLPLGLDGIVAEHFASDLAQRTGGVLLPTQWLPITTLPHRFSLDVPTPTFRETVDALVGALSRMGFKRVAVITGHYAQGHEIELYTAAERLMAANLDLKCFAATPLELLHDDNLLDHAARYETSQLLYYQPSLVQLFMLQGRSAQEKPILGEDPRLGSAEEGEAIIGEALSAWESWLSTASRESLLAAYPVSRERYDGYVERYFKTSWEQAIRDWWAEK